jgi:hypothetical protein
MSDDDAASLLSYDSNASYSSSRANSLRNLQEEYSPIDSNMPFNLYQTLLSIKESMVKVYTLKKTFQVIKIVFISF